MFWVVPRTAGREVPLGHVGPVDLEVPADLPAPVSAGGGSFRGWGWEATPTKVLAAPAAAVLAASERSEWD